jgi:hypothetical protein
MEEVMLLKLWFSQHDYMVLQPRKQHYEFYVMFDWAFVPVLQYILWTELGQPLFSSVELANFYQVVPNCKREYYFLHCNIYVICTSNIKFVFMYLIRMILA